MTTEEQGNPGYEKTDALVRPIVITVAVLLAAIGVCLLIAGLFTRGSIRAGIETAPERSFQHGIVDDSTITRDWRVQDQLVREHLETYGWTDLPKGVARIPLTRAMELLVERDAQQRKGQR